MKASDLYRNLSKERWWASQRKIMRWAAARYYAGVDTLEQLWDSTKPRPVCGLYELAPELTEEEVREIIRLR